MRRAWWLCVALSYNYTVLSHYCPNSRDLAGTLDQAFDEPGPSLVVIPIDYRENALLTKKLGEITCTI